MIVVVDDGGYPLVLHRLDDTQVASVEVGIGKARTAAIFRRPSRDFEEQIKNGRAATLVLPGATPLQGGGSARTVRIATIGSDRTSLKPEAPASIQRA